jgi:hypothetical protein
MLLLDGLPISSVIMRRAMAGMESEGSNSGARWVHVCLHYLQTPQSLARQLIYITTGDRSVTGRKGAFPRKDKMMDHLSRVHADIVGS